MLPSEPKVLLVHTDGVCDGAHAAVERGEVRVEVLHVAHAVAAELERVRVLAHAVLARVERVLAVVRLPRVAVRHHHLREA